MASNTFDSTARTFDGGSTGGGGGETMGNIVYGVVDVPDSRTVIFEPAPASSQAIGLNTAYASVFTQFMSPGDELYWSFGFAKLLGNKPLDTLESIGVTPQAGQLGLVIVTSPTAPIIVDRDAKKIGVRLRTDSAFAGSTVFTGPGVYAGAWARVKSLTTPPDIIKRTAAPAWRNL